MLAPGLESSVAMAQTPDLFVVCKNCGNEVSPYITECPYCGTRLRKRAPRIDRDGGDAVPRNVSPPSLGPLRAGEIPGIKGDPMRRPYVTLALVLLSLFGYLAFKAGYQADLALVALTFSDEPWRIVTSSFVYTNVWYELACQLPLPVGWYVYGARQVGVLVLLLGQGLDQDEVIFPVQLGLQVLP